jgi:sialate O-acetylesterase
LFEAVKTFILFCFACIFPLQICPGKTRVASLIQDHMVLQQGMPVPIAGWDNPGQEITVIMGEVTASGTTGPEGRWRVDLPPLAASMEPGTLKIRGSEELVFSDVLIGEVWLASGQSNMEWRVYQSRDEDIERPLARHPAIREIKVERAQSDTPANSFRGEWKPVTPDNVGNFSAVAYRFARDLQGVLEVPVGIIQSTWGGSNIETWLPAEALSRPPEETGPEPKAVPGPFMTNRLFNAMIHPLLPVALRGVIWYQGESNASAHERYKELFPLLITSWRASLENPEAPFLWVQLSSFEADGAEKDTWGALREAQTSALSLPNTGQALSYDVGDAKDIHPDDKQSVGRRLARLALRDVYGKNIPAHGPVAISVKRERDGFRVQFSNADGGLRTPGVEVRGFEVAGADGVFEPARAVIEEETVWVRGTTIRNPAQLRYAWQNVTEANLFNQRRLPTLPFRTGPSRNPPAVLAIEE